MQYVFILAIFILILGLYMVISPKKATKEKNRNNESKVAKTRRNGFVLIIISTIMLLVLIIFVAIGIFAIYSGLDYVVDKIDDKQEASETRTNTYNSIVSELFQQNILPDNWEYVTEKYAWGAETVNRNRKYYIYNNNEQSDEGNDSHLIAIWYEYEKSDEDTDYANIYLRKDMTYHLVQIYNKDKDNSFSMDYSTLSNQYMVHQENDEWIIEELIREY